MRCPWDFDTGYSSSWDRGKHHSSERIPESHSISARKWVDKKSLFASWCNNFTTNFGNPDGIVNDMHKAEEVKEKLF
jgi:hypothetical protein